MEFHGTEDAYLYELTHGQDHGITIHFYKDDEDNKMTMAILINNQEEADDANNQKS